MIIRRDAASIASPTCHLQLQYVQRTIDDDTSVNSTLEGKLEMRNVIRQKEENSKLFHLIKGPTELIFFGAEK